MNWYIVIAVEIIVFLWWNFWTWRDRKPKTFGERMTYADEGQPEAQPVSVFVAMLLCLPIAFGLGFLFHITQ